MPDLYRRYRHFCAVGLAVHTPHHHAYLHVLVYSQLLAAPDEFRRWIYLLLRTFVRRYWYHWLPLL